MKIVSRIWGVFWVFLGFNVCLMLFDESFGVFGEWVFFQLQNGGFWGGWKGVAVGGVFMSLGWRGVQ